MYKELRERQQDEFNDFPIMFAFSMKQFNEGMKKFGFEENEFSKIVGIGFGGFIRKKDKTKFIEMLKRHRQERKSMLINDEYVIEMFEYEMSNHEYVLTFDDETVIQACDMTMKDMDDRLVKLYHIARNKYIKKCAY